MAYRRLARSASFAYASDASASTIAAISQLPARLAGLADPSSATGARGMATFVDPWSIPDPRVEPPDEETVYQHNAQKLFGGMEGDASKGLADDVRQNPFGGIMARCVGRDEEKGTEHWEYDLTGGAIYNNGQNALLSNPTKNEIYRKHMDDPDRLVCFPSSFCQELEFKEFGDLGDATDDDDGDDEEEQVQPGDATPTLSKALPTGSAVPSASVESAASPEAATAASSSSCDYRCLLSFCINMPGLCGVRIIEAGDEYCRFLSGCPPGRPRFSRIYIPFSPPFRSSAQSSGANPFSFSPTEGSTSSPINPLEG